MSGHTTGARYAVDPGDLYGNLEYAGFVSVISLHRVNCQVLLNPVGKMKIQPGLMSSIKIFGIVIKQSS